MNRRRRINPKDDARYYVSTGKDKPGFDVKHISVFKGRGIFTTAPFEKGDFLLEYQGQLITHQECERRQRIYHDSLKDFMFKFRFDGKLWCVDAAKEDGTLGRLANDDHVNPNAKMKYIMVEGKPHLCLFAKHSISPGEEITYDYGDSDWPWRYKDDAAGTHGSEMVDKPHDTKMAAGTHDTERVDKPHDTKMAAGTHDTERVDKPHDTKMAAGTHDTEMVNKPHDTEMAAGSCPDPRNPSRVGKCKNHHLVLTTVATLDKCIQCVGPVSSLKWLGYECKVYD
ncbi:uncharacterized protein LOC128381831 [Scomber japonicus]|uniref:uncharacterized protein LOC128381831 n=2 Tax=Scomber japonicus TaxID=13676 RepID=UPI00230649BE|nr:uncharacterized protein LOC128381831 [Scomber japonicus]